MNKKENSIIYFLIFRSDSQRVSAETRFSQYVTVCAASGCPRKSIINYKADSYYFKLDVHACVLPLPIRDFKFTPNWVRLLRNGLVEPKCTEIWSEKVPDLTHFEHKSGHPVPLSKFLVFRSWLLKYLTFFHCYWMGK